MFLKEVIPALWGRVNIYEKSSSKDRVSLFNGECEDVPEDLLKRKVLIISGNDFRAGDRAGELSIRLFTETTKEGRKCRHK